MPATLTNELTGRLPEPVEFAAYFVASEALTNVAKHAGASRVSIRVAASPDLAVVEISDDGIGGASTDLGSGLRGLADRVEALGGRLTDLQHAGGRNDRHGPDAAATSSRPTRDNPVGNYRDHPLPQRISSRNP